MSIDHSHPETPHSSHEGAHSETKSPSGLGAWFAAFKGKILGAIGISRPEVDLEKWQNEVFHLGNGTPEGDTKAVMLLIEMLKDPHRSELAKKIVSQAKPFAKASSKSVALLQATLAQCAPELHHPYKTFKKAA